MNDLLAATGVLFVAAITPGPNNVFVMTAAIQGGILSAFRTMGAIIAGSLVLLLLVRFGLDVISKDVPLLTPAIALLGSIYLGWLGFAQIKQHPEMPKSKLKAPQSSYLWLVIFQLLNPKGWVLIGVFLAAGAHADIGTLVTILIVVTFGCLFIWALAGKALSKFYDTAIGRLWIDRLMGTALMIFALLLMLQTALQS